MNIPHSCLQDYLVLFLHHLRLLNQRCFFFRCPLVDDVPIGDILGIPFRRSSTKDIESGSTERSCDYERVRCSTLAVHIGVTVRITHLPALVDCHSDKPLSLFATNHPFNSFIL